MFNLAFYIILKNYTIFLMYYTVFMYNIYNLPLPEGRGFLAEVKIVNPEELTKPIKSIKSAKFIQTSIYNDKTFSKKHNKLFRPNDESSSETSSSSESSQSFSD